MKAIIFAGPSIFGLDRTPYVNCEFLPPASCGDLYRQIRRSPKIICLIDGTFENHPAVWHKEILFALANGIQVVGASSMGALRAAECFRFGMIGLGRIFKQYHSGRRTSDADVAVLHGPEESGYLPLTVSLADAEYAALVLRRRRLIIPETLSTLITIARAVHYKDRTWQKIISQLNLDSAASAQILTACTALSLKRRDAEYALRRINAGSLSPPQTRITLDQFQISQFFHRMAFENQPS